MKKYIPSILWMAVIFILSSIPGPKLPVLPFPGFDKLAHAGEYAILGFLLALAFEKRWFIAFVIGMIYGLLDEIHQLFVPFREFDLLDLSSDIAGVIIGIVCLLLLKKYRLGR